MFDRRMSSSAHNTDASLLRLAQYFRSLAPAFAPDDLQPEKLWRAIYEEKPLKEGVLRVKIRQFTRQVENYLVARELDQDDFLRGLLLLRAQRPNLDYPRYEKEVLKLVNRLDTSNACGPESYDWRIRLRTELTRHPGFDAHKSSGIHLQNLDQDADAWFTLHKYRLSNELQSRQRILGEEYEQRFLDAIVRERAAGLLAQRSAAELYDKLFSLLQAQEAPAELEELREAFNRHGSNIPPEDQRGIFYAILNYLSRRANQGGAEDHLDMLDWYRIGLESGVLLTQGGTISATTFSNITLLGYRAGEEEWTNDFLETYGSCLETGQREETLTACRGTGAFYRGDFTDSITLLSSLITDRNLRLRDSLTVVRALYELLLQGEREYEDVDRAIANFESRLQRETHFSRGALMPYRNHLRFLRRLTKLRMRKNADLKAWGRLHEAVNGEKALVARAWLLEKLEGEKL